MYVHLLVCYLNKLQNEMCNDKDSQQIIITWKWPGVYFWATADDHNYSFPNGNLYNCSSYPKEYGNIWFMIMANTNLSPVLLDLHGVIILSDNCSHVRWEVTTYSCHIN